MANSVYPRFKKACMSGGANHDLLAGSVKLVLVDLGAYAYDDSHEFLSDIPAGARIAISGALTGKSVSDMAAFQSLNGRFDGVIGASIECWVMFIDTGAPGTSRLVFFQDTGVTGLPVTPAGEGFNAIADSAGWFDL